MFLSDKDIESAVKSGDITLEPFDKKRLQPASYDIRLGNVFVVTDTYTTSYIDPENGVYPASQSVKLADGEGFVLHPGASVLGYSKEYFGSNSFLIEVSSKSTLARIGLLVHNSAGLVNPGHFLNIALLISNLNTAPIILRPDMEIAQLTFSPLSSESKTNYKETKNHHLDNVAGYKPPKSGPLARKKRGK